jgi:hypothetical protein
MTAVASLPIAWSPLEAALHERRPVCVSYHGLDRIICPHALGWKNHRAMVLGYQTGGQTSTGALDSDPAKRWRLLFVDEVDRVAVVEPAEAWASATNYNPARPFNAIDVLTLAVPCGTPKTAVR